MRSSPRATAVILSGSVLLAACTPPVPPATQQTGKQNGDPHALGLRPPTDEERARLDAISQKNPPLTPNALARARLNAERQAKGLPPLPTEIPPPPPTSQPK